MATVNRSKKISELPNTQIITDSDYFIIEKVGVSNTTTSKANSNILSLYTKSNQIVKIENANDVVSHNCSSSFIFYHSSISNNFTINLTNFNLSNNKNIDVKIILNQGNNAFIANSVQISNNSVDVYWVNSTSPTGTNNKIDVLNLNITNLSNTYLILGNYYNFG